MGFEQLAELKKQLAAARAEAAPAAKPGDPVVKSIGKLQKRFPNVFPKNPAPKLPLKVGIFEDLVVHANELSLSEAELRDAIKTWCRGSRYWKCLVEGAARVDLTGSEAGRVTAQEAAGAQRLQAHRAAKAAPKAANPTADSQANPTVTPQVDSQGNPTITPQADSPTSSPIDTEA